MRLHVEEEAAVRTISHALRFNGDRSAVVSIGMVGIDAGDDGHLIVQRVGIVERDPLRLICFKMNGNEEFVVIDLRLEHARRLCIFRGKEKRSGKLRSNAFEVSKFQRDGAVE